MILHQTQLIPFPETMEVVNGPACEGQEAELPNKNVT